MSKRISAKKSSSIKGVQVCGSEFGLGVFADKPYLPDDVVGQVNGNVIDDPECGSDYHVDLGGGLSLDPEPPFRFLNHSCEPNCSFVIEENGAEIPKLWVEVNRKIAPGDQLTIDYGWLAESAIPCGCRSETCRGWIVGADEVHKVKEKCDHL
jgi:hypothetical protein